MASHRFYKNVDKQTKKNQQDQEFRQSELIYRLDYTYPELLNVNAQFNGLCELISNYIIANDLLGGDTSEYLLTKYQIDQYSIKVKNDNIIESKQDSGFLRIADEITLEKLNDPKIRGSHILHVSSYLELAQFLFMGKCPYTLFPDSEKIIIDEKLNEELLKKRFSELPDNFYIKFFAYDKALNKLSGHSMVIKKTGNTYSFFDPNFCEVQKQDIDQLITLISASQVHGANLAFVDGVAYINSLQINSKKIDASKLEIKEKLPNNIMFTSYNEQLLDGIMDRVASNEHAMTFIHSYISPGFFDNCNQSEVLAALSSIASLKNKPDWYVALLICPDENKKLYWEKIIKGDEYAQLYTAVRLKDPKMVNFFLELEIKDINKLDKDGHSLLYYAVKNEDVDMVELLLKKAKWSDIETPDKQGKTMLQYAILGDNLEILRLLGNAGANLSAADAQGNTLLHFAIMKNFFNANSASDSHNYKKIIDFLISRIDVNATNKVGDTPLHLGVRYGNEITIENLLNHDARLNVKNNNNETPLVTAACNDLYIGNKMPALNMLTTKMDANSFSQEEFKALFSCYAMDVHPRSFAAELNDLLMSNVVNVLLSAKTLNISVSKMELTTITSSFIQRLETQLPNEQLELLNQVVKGENALGQLLLKANDDNVLAQLKQRIGEVELLDKPIRPSPF